MEREIDWSRESMRQLKKLSKSRHGISKDIESFVTDFSNRNLPGDPVKGVGGLPVKEHRMHDSSSNKGKSGGFRVYYFYNESLIFILLIFLRRDLPTDIGQWIIEILIDSGYSDR